MKPLDPIVEGAPLERAPRHPEHGPITARHLGQHLARIGSCLLYTSPSPRD